MVPVLGLASGAIREDADKAAQDLGTAFQLANFIRDVGEDLDRGRIYLPLDELQSFGVDKEMLKARVLTPQIREALRFNINRVRTLQKSGDAGIKYLSPESRACMEAASELYCGIVDEVEAIGYDVFSTRAKTSLGRRLKVALPAYYRAIRAR
jgi:phytoene synthase